MSFTTHLLCRSCQTQNSSEPDSVVGPDETAVVTTIRGHKTGGKSTATPRLAQPHRDLKAIASTVVSSLCQQSHGRYLSTETQSTVKRHTHTGQQSTTARHSFTSKHMASRRARSSSSHHIALPGPQQESPATRKAINLASKMISTSPL